MTRQSLLKIFKSKNALLKGHFLLSSGLHSDKYIQCALLLQYPEIAERLAEQLVKKLNQVKIDVVISPALGGVIIGQEIARKLKCRAIFAERNKNGKMELRRGFKIIPGEKCLIVEDVITTGGSTKEVIDIVKNSCGEVVGVCAIVDRTQKKIQLDFPIVSLLKLKIKTYLPDKCPMCKANLKISKPGSRK